MVRESRCNGNIITTALEISLHCKNLRRLAVLVIAEHLATCIERFIEGLRSFRMFSKLTSPLDHPEDFIQLHTTGENFSDSVNVLFDTIMAHAEGSRRRICWPALTMFVPRKNSV